MNIVDIKKNSKKKIKKLIKQLETVYENIPSTTGCIENIKTCQAWCCKENNPHVFYIEFMNIWKHVTENFSNQQFLQLIKNAIKNHISLDVKKQCVFFNEENLNCNCHKKRPFACHTYGITPEEEFNEKLYSLRVIYPNESFRNQCNLVKCDKKVFVSHTNKWWNDIKKIEIKVSNNIKDELEGSYKTLHDYIVFQCFNENEIDLFQKIKKDFNTEQKKIFLEDFMKELQNLNIEQKG